MATITIKNIPDELYARLRESAEMNRRSIHSEVIVCIERGVTSRRVDPEAFMERARQLREWTAVHPIDDAGLQAAKIDGRP